MSQLDELVTWCDNESELDIYQVNAFYIGTGSRKQYCIAFLKLFSCFGMQTVGIFLLMEYQWSSIIGQGGQVECLAGQIGPLSVMAFFFASFVTIIISEKLRGLDGKGMYKWNINQPHYVNKCWIGIGFLVNIFVLILSWFVSLVTIFISTSILDMMLNGVAVLFLIDVDEDVVSFVDYQAIKQAGTYSQQSSVGKITDKFGSCLLIFGTYLWRFPTILQFILLPFVVGLPFFVLYCYQWDALTAPDM